MPYCPECSASMPDQAEVCPTCAARLVTTPAITEDDQGLGLPDPEQIEPELRAALAPNYDVLRVLGVGGMGAVFLAREPALKRLVAVKVLHPELAASPVARARFEREATAAAQLSHPNVVRVYAVGETPTHAWPFIVMQYVEGMTLSAWAAERDKVSEREGRRIIGEVASALAAAHQREFVHRDIKPSNVLIEQESGRAYVADFGVAAAISREQGQGPPRLTATGMMIGTPVYMSPEQGAADTVGPPSDVYSLGILAYELMTGELPFNAGSAMTWVAAHLRDVPTPVATHRTDLSPEVVQIIDRCLAKDPAQRPAAVDVARGMMPSLTSEIEWPPPGLTDLRGAAVSIARRCVVGGVAALVLLLALVNIPDDLLPHPGWLDQFVQPNQSSLGMVSYSTNNTPFFLWSAALFIASSALFMALMMAVAGIAHALYRTVRARQSGWRWATLLDVLADRDGDSGLILSGGREYATLTPTQRTGLLHRRRTRTAATLAAGTWPMVVTVGWFGLVIMGLISGSPIIPTAPGWIVVVAILGTAVSLGVSTALGVVERRVVGRRSPRGVDVDTDDIVAWYGTVSQSRDTGSLPGTPLAWRLAVTSVSVVIAVVVVVIVVETAVSAAMAARFLHRTGPPTHQFLARLDELGGDAFAEFQETLDRLSDHPTRPGVDSVAARVIIRRLGGGGDPLPAFPDAALSMSDVRDSVLELFANGLPIPADIRQTVADFESNERVVLFREIAGAPPWSFDQAPLNRPLEEYDGRSALPNLNLGSIRTAMRVNVAAAVIAETDGNPGLRTFLIRQNTLVGRSLMGSWSPLNNLNGWVALSGNTINPLIVIEERRGNASEVSALRRANDYGERVFRTRVWTGGLPGIMVNPHDPSALRTAFSHPGLPPGLKRDLIFEAFLGFCGNPWELLAGAAEERRDTVIAVAASTDFQLGRYFAELNFRGFVNLWGSPESVPWWARARWSTAQWLARTQLCAGF